MEVSLRGVFQEFNASKFVVYCALLLFTLLFALKLDGLVGVPYGVVFLPLWAWKALALSGAVVGCASHRRQPPARNDTASELEFRGMVLCAAQHVLLLAFELLACFKLSFDTALLWTLVFLPLVCESVVSFAVCAWSVRQEKSFELELFFGVNVFQFVFLSLKLDHVVAWSWAVVFVPLWILICLSMIGVLYAIILAVLLIRSIELLPESRRQHIYTAIGYTFLVVPLLIFLVLLTSKLDEHATTPHEEIPFVIVCSPLYISLACLMLMACGSKSGNQWWFGIRRDVCVFLLDNCMCLQQYGNVSYKFGEGRSRRQSADGADAELSAVERPPAAVAVSRDLRPVQPVTSIECPD